MRSLSVTEAKSLLYDRTTSILQFPESDVTIIRSRNGMEAISLSYDRTMSRVYDLTMS